MNSVVDACTCVAEGDPDKLSPVFRSLLVRLVQNETLAQPFHIFDTSQLGNPSGEHQQEERNDDMTVLAQNVERLRTKLDKLAEVGRIRTTKHAGIHGRELLWKESVSLMILLLEIFMEARRAPNRAVVVFTYHKWCSLALVDALEDLEVAEEMAEIDMKQIASSREHNIVVVSVTNAEHVCRGAVPCSRKNKVLDRRFQILLLRVVLLEPID